MINNIKNKYSFLSIVLILLAMQSAWAVEIKVTVDHSLVNINESFQLTFSATESPDEEPDFSALNKDFEILNNSKSTNSSWMNGKYTKSIKWTLNVMAKNVGNLVIPAVAFGEDKSNVTILIVTSSNATPAQTNKQNELFLEVQATPTKVYVQSQVLYTLKVYRSVQVAQASLTEPEMADALVEKLGEDKNYTTEINGEMYKVTERKYAIFPQKSGTLIIEPLVLTAEVVAKTSPRFNGFFNRQVTKTKRAMSKAITLDVQAAPADFTGKHWIPAEQVYIEESWSGDVNNMKVGEPLTRTLTLLAKGTTIAQLPELHSKLDIPQLKNYPDQPVLKEKKQADGLIAFREEKIAYIPSKAGSFTLPEIKIPWFNTQTQKMEVARIAAKTVTAVASATLQTNNTVIAPPQQTNTAEPKAVIQVEENKFWMWLSIILACGWLITLLLFFIKGKQKPKEIPANTKEIKLKEIVKALKQACAKDDQVAAKDALLAWGKIKYNSDNLSTIASHCEARLRDEIVLLNQNLYADQSKLWQGKKLFQTFTENNARETVVKKIDDSLEPLYKA